MIQLLFIVCHASVHILCFQIHRQLTLLDITMVKEVCILYSLHLVSCTFPVIRLSSLCISVKINVYLQNLQ
jgi:hypothetical protein